MFNSFRVEKDIKHGVTVLHTVLFILNPFRIIMIF